MSNNKLVRIVKGTEEAEIVPTSLAVWRKRGWDLAPKELRDDSTATLEPGGPATATIEE